MAESIHEQAMEAIKTAMEGIVGDSGTTFWYTPGVVIRTHDINRKLLNDKYDVIYAFAPSDPSEEPPEAVGGLVDERYFYGFLLAKKHLLADEPYKESTPLRWTVATRLARDFKKKLWEDVTLGGIVDNAPIERISMAAELVFIESWVVVIGQGRLNSEHDKGAP